MLNIERLRINEFSELKNTTPFSPSINKKSDKLCKQRSNLKSSKNNNLNLKRQEDTFNYLYNDYKVRMENMKELFKIHRDKECLFIPNSRINNSKKSMNGLESLAFVNRMEVKNILSSNSKIIKSQETAKEEKKTPLTRKNPSLIKRISRSPIKKIRVNESEASNKIRFNNSNEDLKNTIEEERKKEILKLSILKSEKMIEKMKRIAFQKIYKILDSKNIGKIEILKVDKIIDFKFLEKKLGSIWKDLLNIMKNYQEPINENEFYEICYKVYTNLSVAERNKVLRFGKPEEKAVEDSPHKFEVLLNSQQ